MLEKFLERIAIALEKQNALTEQIISGNKTTVAVDTKKKGRDTPPPAAPVIDVDPFADTEAEVLTVDKLKELLTLHAKAFGTKVTIELIKKHGADAATPKINTIPEASWKACFDEAKADLAKVKK